MHAMRMYLVGRACASSAFHEQGSLHQRNFVILQQENSQTIAKHQLLQQGVDSGVFNVWTAAS